MYYALFDSNGYRITTYIEGIHINIPPEAIEISDEDQNLYATNNYIRDQLTGKPVIKPPYVPTTEEKLTAIRAQRDQLLAESDWTDTLSAKSRLGETLYNAWQEYRQALRDMPETCDVDNLVWPEKPL